MEAAAALVSFVGLAGPVAQGLKFLYDLTTDMKDCPRDIREMKTDLELVESLITQVIRQCNERDGNLLESVALARAIHHAQERVEDLKKELAKYLNLGPRKRFRFVAKFNQIQKLRTSLDRTKTTMFELKTQLQSDLLYDIHDTSQEVLRSIKNTNKDPETNDRRFQEMMQKSEVRIEDTKESTQIVQASAELGSETPEGLTDIKVVEKKLEHITDLLTESRISSSPISQSSTIALSREASDNSFKKSSQEITSEHPLLQFKSNQFQFLVAIIFTQRTSKQQLACQRASKCLGAYPTPEAFAKALPGALSQYFSGLGLQNIKPLQLIKLAQAYIKDPPEQGRMRSKANCPQSEISHLPQIGLSSVNSWLVYCCERIDIRTEDKTLVNYMEYLKSQAGNNCV
ncbi:hypothetical protein E8E13_002404 [Curvularia kusanoi]|uniref:Fungal N-terminal domain-containing protein n=1 Tax=Curvularia kusanoi TaxID=90978 RepID=A0A9P4W2K2_CURKU|nr:hypothetical protein E8E13_002404 [Curvularia kusanoi]